MARFPQRLALLGPACALAVAVGLAVCADEEEAGNASPTATAARAMSPSVRSTARATATTLASTPSAAAPTPQAGQPVWAVFHASSEEQLQILLEDGLGDAYIVAVAGAVDFEAAQWEKWSVYFAGDLNADGLDDAIVLRYTGGAHCCREYMIFSEGPNGIQRDDIFSLGNGNIETVEDLDGDGVPELEGSDDRLAYFPNLGFFGSPFLPLVLCRSADGTYHDCTPRFPERLQESAREFERLQSDAIHRQVGAQSAALGLLASYMRLGRDDEGWDKVRSMCPECEDWLRQTFGELEQRVRYQHPQPLFPE